ncbi:MAG: ABC transporter ATP-binding protein/permease [Lachnospiraceae bacterium]|nr:ABC transporter ATP-binding protein/permease [Lachnospiraceae bacterium]
MSDFKESKDNPLHKDFGIWSNTKYIFKKMAKYYPSVIAIMLLGVICNSVLSYFWGIFGKYVIDIIEAGMSKKEAVTALIKLIAFLGSIAVALQVGVAVWNHKCWYRYIFVRMYMITERVSKVLRINFELLERPDVLDISERAAQATGGNWNGVEGMMQYTEQILQSLVTTVVTFVAVTVLDWRLILALVVLCALQFLFYRWVVKKDKKEVWDKLSNTWRKTNYMERVTQDFEYAKDIRLFSLSEFLAAKQQKVYDGKIKRLDYHHNIWFVNGVVSQMLYVFMRILIYGALYAAVFKDNLSIGNFTLFLSLALAFSGALQNMLQRFGDLKRCSLETDDFRSFVELDLGDDEKDCIPLKKADSYEIEFKNVSYKYRKADGYALKNLNLKLKKGEKLAVVGLNGAGKTTMIKLLLRLYDPTEGVITLNGVDIKKYKREDYYKLFSPVFQDIDIFAFLMSENIAMEDREKLDIKKAEKAVRDAGLSDKIDSLPRGVETPLTNIVEDDGIDLSGGEKQKLALARALYKGAKIIVLDEPTSALDAIAEQQLYEKFDDMVGDKSAVYISHRLASTRFCDRIAMFKEGRMVEYGSHDELMDKGGEYAQMFNVQAQYYKEGVNDQDNEGGINEGKGESIYA